MKIITKGQIPEERMYRVVCRNCHTVFEFQYKEAQEVFDQRDGNYLKIPCPLCSKEQTIDVKNNFQEDNN